LKGNHILSITAIIKKFSAEKTEVYERGREKFKLRHEWLSTSSVVMIKLVTGDEDTNEILLEWFVSARSRDIPVSRITQIPEDVESVWLQLRRMGRKIKHTIFSETLLEYQVRWKPCCFFADLQYFFSLY
jgi:hypothetical protein